MLSTGSCAVRDNDMKRIWMGQEDSGKSYHMAIRATEILDRNAGWLKITGKPRPIISNMKFSEAFEKKARSKGIPIVYWKYLNEVVGLEEGDLFIDEIGTFFDSRMWTTLSLDTRRWVAQTSKVGLDFYGTAQDFAQIDLSFRRLVNKLELVTKVFGSRRPSKTKPPVRRVWGLGMIEGIVAQPYNEQEKQSTNFLKIPGFFVFRKKYTDVFDTRQRQEKSPPMPFEHIERHCPICGKNHVTHV